MNTSTFFQSYTYRKFSGRHKVILTHKTVRSIGNSKSVSLTDWMGKVWLVSVTVNLTWDTLFSPLCRQASQRSSCQLFWHHSTIFIFIVLSSASEQTGKFSKIHFYNNQNTLWTEDTNKYKISPRNITAISQIFPTFPMEELFLTFSVITYYLHYVTFFFLWFYFSFLISSIPSCYTRTFAILLPRLSEGNYWQLRPLVVYGDDTYKVISCLCRFIVGKSIEREPISFYLWS